MPRRHQSDRHNEKTPLTWAQVVKTTSTSTVQRPTPAVEPAPLKKHNRVTFFRTPLVNTAFDDLYQQTIAIPEKYLTQREAMNQGKWFASLRSGANPARQEDAAFLKEMAELIQSNRALIEMQDPSLLTSALSGVLLVELQKIHNSYETSYALTKLVTSIHSSALALVLFEILKIKQFTEIEPAKIKTDLEALKKCLAILNTRQELKDTKIIALIGDIDTQLAPVRTAEAEKAPAPAIA